LSSPLESSIQKYRDFLAVKPNAPMFKREFGYYVLDKWIEQGYLKSREEVADYSAYLREMFNFDEPPIAPLTALGGCEASLLPRFEEKVLEDRGEYELVQDYVGRHLLCFKGRRSGFMPEYVDHPVKDMKTWERDIKWRMDAETPGRELLSQDQLTAAVEGAKKGMIVEQSLVGGYMYLRSLMGPEELLFKFYDEPELVHACMKQWFDLADAVITRHQKKVAIDDFFLLEDICYNKGPLISPDMIKEFLFPYYSQLYQNVKKRNPAGHVTHFQVDTDGFCEPVIELYRSIGVDYFSPFEIASNNDALAVAERYPELKMHGAIDKRVLATTTDEIDRYLEKLLPPLKKRGGFFPTCDHGVPEEVSFENYVHFRKRIDEYSK